MSDRVVGRESGLGEETAEAAKKRGPGRPPSKPRTEAPDERIAAEREQGEREFTEDRELNDDERLEMFMDSMQQRILPDLPHFPGWHCFWATTTNQNDSVQRRLLLGYKLIRVEEFPGWEGIGVKTAGVDGVVGLNEMVAMRLPLRLYQKYMMYVHHTQPLEQEEMIKAIIAKAAEQASAETGRTADIAEEGDGTRTLVQRTKAPPVFSE